jgi:SAM-dependent methyltransferase
MNGIGVLKMPARRCLRLPRKMSGKTPSRESINPEDIPFVCNVCGTSNRLPKSRLTREDGHCVKCGCHGRLRSMMYAVTAHFSPKRLILARMKPHKDIRGIGCSDWGYADLLADKFNYVNTFYDRDPQLDLCNVDWSRWTPGSIDFITCTDVLEHIEPPIERTFDNMRRLLKPGGVAILTVPTNLEPATREHFPHLHQWRLCSEDDRRFVVNRRLGGALEQFHNLCFHGGEGMTFEFRSFSRNGLIKNIQNAGLRIKTIYDRPVGAYAIPLNDDNFVVVAQKLE